MDEKLNRRTLLGAGAMAAIRFAVPRNGEAAWIPSSWGATEKRNVKLVNDFLLAWENKDAEGIAKMLAPDSSVRVAAHQQNVPPLKGPDAAASQAKGFFANSGVKFKILETVATGPLVINNRIDRITAPNRTFDLYYSGVFFVQNGKIKEWSDYEVAPQKAVKPGDPL